MVSNVIKFITYNNAVPLVLGILFLGSGIAFAANDDVRDATYSVEKNILTIDNTYIANKDLSSFSPSVSIVNISEDDEIYYVEYNFHTISLKDAAWQDVISALIIEVEKKVLIDGSITLGDYITEQLRQEVEGELAFLNEVQLSAKKSITNKVVATEYSGLIGKFIDDTTQEFPKYVQPPKTSSVSNQRANLDTAVVADLVGPEINILGANPTRIKIGSTYNDLGAFVVDQNGTPLDLKIELSLNNVAVSNIEINTSIAANWSVGYLVTDQNGSVIFTERSVIVYDPSVPEVLAPVEETTTIPDPLPSETPVETTSTTTITSTTTQDVVLEDPVIIPEVLASVEETTTIPDPVPVLEEAPVETTSITGAGE